MWLGGSRTHNDDTINLVRPRVSEIDVVLRFILRLGELPNPELGTSFRVIRLPWGHLPYVLCCAFGLGSEVKGAGLQADVR